MNVESKSLSNPYLKKIIKFVIFTRQFIYSFCELKLPFAEVTIMFLEIKAS